MDEMEYGAVLLFLKQGVSPIHWSEEQKTFYSHNFFVFKNTLHRTQSKLPIARCHELLKIILSAHINPAGEHLEEEETTCVLMQHFHVADPGKEVRNFIDSCNVCLRRRLQHTRQMLVEKDQKLATILTENKSLQIYQKHFLDLQVTVHALKSNAESTKSKLVVCETMNQRLLSSNASISEQLSRKLYEFRDLQEKYYLKTVLESKRAQEVSISNEGEELRQKITFKHMWHQEVENNKSLRKQCYEKSEMVRDLQDLLKKKLCDIEKMRHNVNFLQSACSAQAKQVKELEKLVREKNDPIVVDDCEVVVLPPKLDQ